MSTTTMGNGEALTKDQLIEKIRQIIKSEKFKLDAFFLCGAASGLPNDGLKKACEKYLETADAGKTDEAVTAQLITELEATLATEPKIKVVGDINDNRKDIQLVYDNRAAL